METLLTSGRIAELILALMAIEIAALLLLWFRYGIGVRPLSLIANMAAGGSLVAALYVALTSGSPYTLAAILLLSLLAHVADMATRWKRRAPEATTTKR